MLLQRLILLNSLISLWVKCWWAIIQPGQAWLPDTFHLPLCLPLAPRWSECEQLIRWLENWDIVSPLLSFHLQEGNDSHHISALLSPTWGQILMERYWLWLLELLVAFSQERRGQFTVRGQGRTLQNTNQGWSWIIKTELPQISLFCFSSSVRDHYEEYPIHCDVSLGIFSV